MENLWGGSELATVAPPGPIPGRLMVFHRKGEEARGMASGYLLKIRFAPDKQGHPDGQWLKLDGQCGVGETIELQKPEDFIRNAHLATLPGPRP